MRYIVLLILPFQLVLARVSAAQGQHPGRATKPLPPLYDSTKMDLRASPGISHKTAMQAVRTYGKIGAGQPLNHADSVFLRQWSPAIIGAPDNEHPPQMGPGAKRKQ